MFIKKFSLVAMVAMAIGGLTVLTATDANAQASSTAAANVNATINNPIVLTNTADLSFGSAAPSVAASTIIVDTTGGVSGTAIGLGGTPTAAGFTVSGLPNQTYAVTLPTDTDVVLTGPGTDMTVTSFNHDATGTLSSAATQPDAFGVGATLNINANQTSGAYSGSFSVTVAYN